MSLPLPALAQQPPAQAAPADTSRAAEPSLDEAREAIKSGDYDHAIEILRNAIVLYRNHVAIQKDAYLLLIKTYVFAGNELKFKPQGREQSNLSYKAAREQIAECLRVKELRHTRPEPASEYPPEMISLFADVRNQIFGSFRVIAVTPSNATILLDADTLRLQPGVNALGDVDLTLGPHLVIARQQGFKDVTDEITISPNSTLERSYQLSKKRGAMWYASWATGALGVVGGTIALVAGKKSTSTPTDEPLPPPPGTPSQ